MHGAWCTVHGAWCMVHDDGGDDGGAQCRAMGDGAWCMVHEVRRWRWVMAHDACGRAHGDDGGAW